jgi:hypothetical protein
MHKLLPTAGMSMLPGNRGSTSCSLHRLALLTGSVDTKLYCAELFEAIGKPYITIISDGPYSETSATSNYGNQSKSWLVHFPDGSSENRKCVTTRQDGVVRVTAYYVEEKPYLNVYVHKGSVKSSYASDWPFFRAMG